MQSVVEEIIKLVVQPEAYIGAYHTLIDENGALSNEGTKKFLNEFLSDFAAWIEKLS